MRGLFLLLSYRSVYPHYIKGTSRLRIYFYDGPLELYVLFGDLKFTRRPGKEFRKH